MKQASEVKPTQLWLPRPSLSPRHKPVCLQFFGLRKLCGCEYRYLFSPPRPQTSPEASIAAFGLQKSRRCSSRVVRRLAGKNQLPVPCFGSIKSCRGSRSSVSLTTLPQHYPNGLELFQPPNPAGHESTKVKNQAPTAPPSYFDLPGQIFLDLFVEFFVGNCFGWHVHSRTVRFWGFSACADTADVSGSGGTGVSVAMRGSQLRSAAALCLDELPESQRSRTTAREVACVHATRIITFAQLVRTSSEPRPCYQDKNVRATSPDMFMCFKSQIVLSKQYL